MHQPMRAPATCTRCIAQRTKIYRDIAAKLASSAGISENTSKTCNIYISFFVIILNFLYKKLYSWVSCGGRRAKLRRERERCLLKHEVYGHAVSLQGTCHGTPGTLGELCNKHATSVLDKWRNFRSGDICEPTFPFAVLDIEKFYLM